MARLLLLAVANTLMLTSVGALRLVLQPRACLARYSQSCMALQSTTRSDSWDDELFRALGGGEEGEAPQAVPLLSEEEELAMREARYLVRLHCSRVVHTLVKVIQRMFTARFPGASDPLNWKSIRKAALETRKDLGTENIQKAEASRLFIRNTLKKKLAACDVEVEAFFAAADVQSSEWRDCRRRGADKEETRRLNSKGQECFIELPTAELIERVYSIELPSALSESFGKTREVLRKTATILEEDERLDQERSLLKLASSHLGESNTKKRNRYYQPRRASGSAAGSI